MYQSTRRYTTDEDRNIAKKILIYCRYDYTVAQLVALQLPRWLHHTSHTPHTAHHTAHHTHTAHSIPHTAHTTHTHTHNTHSTLNITFHLYLFKWTPQPGLFQQKLYSYWACTFVRHTHRVIQEGRSKLWEVTCIGHIDKNRSYEHLSNSEWLPRQCCSSLHYTKHCEWRWRKRNCLLLITF
jgi:hypothetical protein